MKITKKLSLVGISLAMVAVAVGAASYTNARVANATYDYSDVLTPTQTGVTASSYTDWTYTSSTSGVAYSGNCAGGNSSVQLRSSGNNSGIVTTTSKLLAKHVSVSWNTNTTNGRTLNVYGSNTAYTSAADLYNTAKAGTLLGTIVKGTSTELTITGDYTYVGVRSASSAMYLDDVTFDWDSNSEPDLSLSATASSIYTDESVTFTAERMNSEANIVWSVNNQSVTGTASGNTSTYVLENKEPGTYTVKAALEGTTISKTAVVEVKEVEYYEKVTSVAQLTAGTQVVLASADGTAVAKAHTGGNNIQATTATLVEGKLKTAVDASPLTVGVKDGKYSFKTADDKYLYAPTAKTTSGSNYLKIQDAEAYWDVTFDGNTTTIQYSDATKKGLMQYNGSSGSSLFSCYASLMDSEGFQGVTLYAKKADATEANWADEFLSAFSTICQADGSSNKVAVQTAWNNVRTTVWNTLSEDAKNTVKAYTEETAGNAGEAVALYNYIFAKYGAELNLTDYVWGKTPVARINVTNNIMNTNNSLLIVVISSITLLGFAGFALKKKSK